MDQQNMILYAVLAVIVYMLVVKPIMNNELFIHFIVIKKI